MKVGILTDYPSTAVQSGPATHTRFLYEGLTERGHDVTLIGPDTGDVMPIDGPRTVLYPGRPYPAHPKVKVVLPGPLRTMAAPPRLDVVHGQIANHAMEYSGWMRRLHRTAVLNTHIIHFPDYGHFLVGDKLYANPLVRLALEKTAWDYEREIARLYNLGDALIVQSRHMVEYWRERGVNVPIEVVGRPIDPRKFSRQPAADPFPAHFAQGRRLLLVSRQDREKGIDRAIEIFDRHIAPAEPDATLTLVGYGHEHAHLVRLAAEARHADRIWMPGEVAHDNLLEWYAHADVFVYTSLSETFGNVVNEALWTGLPVVALDDRKGVAHQIVDGVNGFLVPPDQVETDARFARGVLDILRSRTLHRQMAESAANLSRRVAHPNVVLSRFEAIYERAIQRAHDQVAEPLEDASAIRRNVSLARVCASWARWNLTPFALDAAMRAVGLARMAPTMTESAEIPLDQRRPMPLHSAPITAAE